VGGGGVLYDINLHYLTLLMRVSSASHMKGAAICILIMTSMIGNSRFLELGIHFFFHWGIASMKRTQCFIVLLVKDNAE
jgi:hypothetical protein